MYPMPKSVNAECHNPTPEGLSTQRLWLLGPKTLPSMVFGTGVLKCPPGNLPYGSNDLPTLWRSRVLALAAKLLGLGLEGEPCLKAQNGSFQQ